MLEQGLGWIPDPPDFRDFTPEHGEIKPLLQQAAAAEPAAEEELPRSVDLRKWCSPVENQLTLNSCTANAGVALVEYFQRRALGKHTDSSRLFLYKVTRNLLQWPRDEGAYLRTTAGALTLFGVPPEEYWPYDVKAVNAEPPPFCYAFAQSYQAIKFFRLDPPDATKADVLGQIKTLLAAGFPSMFGFVVYSPSIQQADETGEIPFPSWSDKDEGGHAVVAVGYDDDRRITNTELGGKETEGALLIRNSWGKKWGANGYGWLPYDYVLSGLAVDWWSLIENEWVDTGEFGLNGR